VEEAELIRDSAHRSSRRLFISMEEWRVRNRKKVGKSVGKIGREKTRSSTSPEDGVDTDGAHHSAGAVILELEKSMNGELRGER